MNKVITVNLNGNAYQLEESGYDALRVYLEGAAQRLGKNPDRDEIIADIEQAIADKFQSVLGKFKSVVATKEVLAVIAEMGPVQDDGSETDSSSSAGQTPPPASTSNATAQGASRESTNEAGGPARRLYKIPDGAMVAGVCNGIAAHFALDVIIVRLAFLAGAVLIGLMALLVHWLLVLPILAYTVLALTLPAANTAAERAAARGDPSTAQEYIRRAKQGYYEGIKTFAAATNDHKHWKQKYKREMRSAYQSQHYTPGSWPRAAAPSFALPAIGLMEAAVLVVWLLCLISLITKGSVLGLVLPEGVPLWIGIVALSLALNVLLWPLKAFKHACYASISGDRDWAYRGGFFDSLVWLSVVVAGIWLGDHYFPAVHEFIVALPAKIDAAAKAIQDWWNHH